MNVHCVYCGLTSCECEARKLERKLAEVTKERALPKPLSSTEIELRALRKICEQQKEVITAYKDAANVYKIALELAMKAGEQ